MCWLWEEDEDALIKYRSKFHLFFSQGDQNIEKNNPSCCCWVGGRKSIECFQLSHIPYIFLSRTSCLEKGAKQRFIPGITNLFFPTNENDSFFFLLWMDQAPPFTSSFSWLLPFSPDREMIPGKRNQNIHFPLFHSCVVDLEERRKEGGKSH